MMLTLMGTLAQNEVESTSKNVKMGIKMKMKRGELMGFNGCLGYDYHPEDKTITVNEAEAETVRLIFELYLQGYGTYTIARRLEALGNSIKRAWQNGRTVVCGALSRMRSIKVICFCRKPLPLIRFPRGESRILVKRSSIMSETIMSLL